MRSPSRGEPRASAGFSANPSIPGPCSRRCGGRSATGTWRPAVDHDHPSVGVSSSVPASRNGAARQPTVVLVDDDASVREGLSELLLSAGLHPACFASTREMLGSDALESPGCLILDVRMPGTSGLALQDHMARTGNTKPIIFLTGHGDIPMSVQAMKAGAVDFLTKPVRDQTLLDAVLAAIELDAARRAG